ncbi:hypothetical protein FTO70_08580 [Methanosarcina sp. KYL-1]|nr:hypothetical protein [Methanosarcina sp. KYL-1]
MDNTRIFKKITYLATTFILYVLVIALILGMVKIVLDLRFIIDDSLENGFKRIVSSVLSIFIVIDLFKTFVDFHEHERIKLTYVTDAAILVLLREITVGIYAQEFGYEFILCLSFLLLVLGLIRVMAIKYSPSEGSHTPGR